MRRGPYRRWRFGLALALAFVMLGCADEMSMVAPTPPDLRVVPPPPGVSQEHARFSGRWVGKWDEQLEHVLIVELEVPAGPATEVIAVYSWGGGSLGVWRLLRRCRSRTLPRWCACKSRRRRMCKPRSCLWWRCSGAT